MQHHRPALRQAQRQCQICDVATEVGEGPAAHRKVAGVFLPIPPIWRSKTPGQKVACRAKSAFRTSHLEEIGIAATAVEGDRAGRFRLVPDPSRQLGVSIVIPTAGKALSDDDGAELAVQRCLSSIAACARPNLEVVLIVGDEYQGDSEQLAGPEHLAGPGLPIRVERRPPGRLNFSAACNQGILAARNELVLILNDDTEMDPGAIDAMALHFGDPSIGAGAPPRTPTTVQHAGMIVDDAHPLHPFVGWPAEDSQRFGGTVARDVIAVTGARLMSRQSLLLSLGAFSIDFPWSFNAVDLCLKIRRSGCRVIIEPGASLAHRESFSREPRIHDWEWERWIDRWGRWSILHR